MIRKTYRKIEVGGIETARDFFVIIDPLSLEAT